MVGALFFMSYLENAIIPIQPKCNALHQATKSCISLTRQCFVFLLSLSLLSRCVSFACYKCMSVEDVPGTYSTFIHVHRFEEDAINLTMMMTTTTTKTM